MSHLDIRRLGPADAGDYRAIRLAALQGDAAAFGSTYRRLGFEIYGTEPRALKSDDGYADEILMVRFLLTATRTAAD